MEHAGVLVQRIQAWY